MNIFFLDIDPEACAKFHCDKHVVKMILESAQLLSTAHRILDGVEYTELSDSGRRLKRWKVKDAEKESLLYKATHVNHPCAIWARSAPQHYAWLYALLTFLCKEYTYRYGKVHKVEREGLLKTLGHYPLNIKKGNVSPPPKAMPDQYKNEDSTIESYRNYYKVAKKELLAYRKREIPEWLSS
jgi:hypothetical protein